MIKVENLTKKYAGQTAIRDLNFEVGKGEIMGFLGPNGAGKTTTMRILASFMPPTSGRASIAGFDIFEQSLQARAHLGYMPENVPLYNDMRVNEYLNYRAALKSIPHRRISERVGDVKELCGLREVENKLIRALSKGFRQRVGLADALLHEPDLLILDEPTIGLDPNQIRQVRELIKNLGQTTHDSAFDPHFAGGRDDLHAGHHYQQRAHRSVRHAGEFARSHSDGRRSDAGSEGRRG